MKKSILPTIILIVIFIAAIAGSAYFLFKDIRHKNPQTISSNIQQVESENHTNKNGPVGAKQENTVSPQKMAIFMYHHIRVYNDPNDSIGTNLSIPPADFEAQVKTLKDAGYQTISMADYLKGNIQPKSVIITFDDGYDNAFTAYGILKKYNFTGVFYIISRFLDTPGYLTKDQLKTMQQGGMIIGSHTLDHPDLTVISAVKAKDEIDRSKIELEAILNTKITDFCYPAGKYSQTTIDDLKADGYLTATTTKSPSQAGFKNFFELPRFRINPGDTGKTLLNRIGSL